jgi:hypothetical protein
MKSFSDITTKPGRRAVVGRMTLFQLKGAHMSRRFLVLAIAAGCALAASNAVAAPERVRGTIASISGDTLTVVRRLVKVCPLRSRTVPAT